MSNNANVAAAIKEVAHKVFGGYAELLRMPHTARFSIGSVIACMPFPMVGMTITIAVPRRDSAVGRDEPRPLDDHAQGRPGAHRPRALAVRRVR